MTFTMFSPRAAGGALFACWLAFMPAGGALASAKVDQDVRNALQLDQNRKQGKKLYTQHCQQCHGPQALGNADNTLPSLAGQRRAYLIKQLADFTALERDSRPMHVVVSQPGLGEPQSWADISGYLNSLPAARFPESGDGGNLELGEAIFQEQCASCHEEDGRGDDDGFVPSLRNQHYRYLVRQMRSIASWHRTNVEADLVRFLDSLDSEEATAVADYVSRLRGPTRDRSRMNDDGTVND